MAFWNTDMGQVPVPVRGAGDSLPLPFANNDSLAGRRIHDP